jgi:hypothetical protein
MTKGKAYILRQIRDLVQEKRGYDEEESEAYVKEHLEKTVYELLVLKKDLENEERDPGRRESYDSSHWYKGELRY